jgi:hypothetical protein
MPSLLRQLLPWLCSAAALAQTPPNQVRYGRDVRPILADKCFRCHGPDAGTREGKLRLDERDAATAVRADGSRAIAPGDHRQSLVWQRVGHTDPAERMPPRTSGKSALTAAEQATLAAWIDADASYEPHWAFVPPQRPAVPQVPGAEPIEAFLRAAQDAHGLVPAPLADRSTLVRRAFLVLTGLPPTPAETAAFLADARPDAFARLVDTLLDSEPYRTRYAEHLASVWLDAARYADTCGIHMDAGRQIWPWRDWLLRALRDDLPFDRFVIEQLAGDQLPEAALDQRVATGFLRAHVTTDEGGAIDEEYRVEYAAERTSTVGSVFLGLTVGCARCHDHKYDPVRQEDYYRLFAFFNQNQEPGLYSQVPDSNRALEPFLKVPDAALEAEAQRTNAALAAAEAQLEVVPPEEAAQRAAFDAELAALGAVQWPATHVLTARSRHGAQLTLQGDGSVLASGPNPKRDVHELQLASEGGNLRLLCLEALPDASLPNGRVGRAPNGNAVLGSLRLWARPLAGGEWQRVPLAWAAADYEQDNGDFFVTNTLRDDPQGFAVGAHLRPPQPVRVLFLAEAPFGDAAGTELRVELHYDTVYDQHVFGRVRLSAGSLGDGLLARLGSARGGLHYAGPFAANGPEALYSTAFGPEQAAAFAPQQTWGKVGWRFDPALRDGQAFSRLPEGQNATYVAQELFLPRAREVRLALGSDDGFQLYHNGREVAARRVDRGVAPDQDRAAFAAPAGRSLLVLKVVNTGGQGGAYLRHDEAPELLSGDLRLWLLPPWARDAALDARLAAAWRERFSPTFAAGRARVQALRDQLVELDRRTPRTMVMQDAPMPRPTFVLRRGDYDKPDPNRPVTASLPAMFGSLPADQLANRAALARWLVAEANPLLLRVQVNRLWEFVFGTGIVRTSEDFGLQGEWPSHPELLDWLVAEYRNRGLSTKALLKLLCTSAAFQRQSTLPAAARAQDPQNRLLTAFPRRRLSAEAIRDQALYAAGLLVERLGGPSVKPYQPEGLWQEVAMLQSNTRVYERGSGEALWRRSLYTYWKRACPPPTLQAFDAPTREFCTIRRSSTNTPLQALALWNDEQFVEAARLLAQRALQASTDDATRLDTAHQLATGRPLDADERTDALALLATLRTRYGSDRAAAEALVAVGQAPRAANLDPAELAAFTLLASAFLNLDTTLCID